MQIFPFVVVAWILAVGLYGVVTSRHLVHQIVCLIVVQSSTYVLLLGVGYVTGAVAPYFYDVPVHTPAVDPVVQALALTDVVVEAAVTALLLAFAIQAHKRFGTLDPQEARRPQGLRARPPWISCWPWSSSSRCSARPGCPPSPRSSGDHRRALDTVAIAAAACVTVLLVVITTRAAHGGLQVYWFAGFRPRHGIAIGIDFAVDPLGAGLACLAAVLATATMSSPGATSIGSRPLPRHDADVPGGPGRLLPDRGHLDLFVWFELMGVSAYALTAYRPEERPRSRARSTSPSPTASAPTCGCPASASSTAGPGR